MVPLRIGCIRNRWAEAPIKIARMTLTIKLNGNWNSFQLANSTPPLSVTDSAIAPSARMPVDSPAYMNKYRMSPHESVVLCHFCMVFLFNGRLSSSTRGSVPNQCSHSSSQISCQWISRSINHHAYRRADAWLHIQHPCGQTKSVFTVTPKGVLRLARCHASATRKGF